MPAPPGRHLPALAAFGAPLLALVALSWPLPLHLGSWHALTAFGDSHAWVLDLLGRHLARGEFPTQTAEAGYPVLRDLRFIGLAPLAAALPLRALFGTLAAANLVQLLSLPTSGLAAYGLLRRWTDVDAWSAAALGAAWALGPTLLSTYGLGEISNTQGWILPGFLLVLDRTVYNLRWIPALVAFCAVAVFSSPYFALALPLLVGAYALTLLRAKGLARPVILVAAVALGLGPSQLYYGSHGSGDSQGVFRPAQQATAGVRLAFPPPVARPLSLVWDLEPVPRSPYEPMHQSYLGLALVLAAGAAAVAGRGQRGRRAGLALALGGVALALGPYLAHGDDYVRVGGRLLALPVRLLEAVGYPTRKGGLYFRYAALAELGLVLVVAAGLAGRRRAPWLAWGLLVVHLADSVQGTGPLWPRPSEPVPDRTYLQTLGGEDGAVLELPLQGPTDAAHGQGALLRAVFHGRPTTALPRDVRPRETPLPALVRAAVAGDTRARLSQAGFRYVMLPETLRGQLDADSAALIPRLGAPVHEGAVTVWDLAQNAVR